MSIELSLFYTLGNKRSEKISNLLKLTKMVSDGGDLQIQVGLTLELELFITLQHCLS